MLSLRTPYRFLITLLFTAVACGLTPAQYERQVYLEGANVTDVTNDGEMLWFSTYGRGIHGYHLQTGEWTHFSVEEGNLDEDLFYCIAASEDFLWAGTANGLYTYDRKKENWRTRKFAKGGQYGNWIRALRYDEKEDLLWIGRFINLSMLDVRRKRYEDFDMTLGGDQKTNNFVMIKLEGDDFIWFGTEAGVFRYDKSKDINDRASLEFFSNQTKNFLGEGKYVSVSDMEFITGDIWFATDEFISDENPDFNIGGLYRFNRKAYWEKFDVRNGLPANGVFAIERTGNDIWASCYEFDNVDNVIRGRGIALINRVSGDIRMIDPDVIGLTTNTINTMYFDGDWMWLGTDEGLWRLRVTNPLAVWNAQE